MSPYFLTGGISPLHLSAAVVRVCHSESYVQNLYFDDTAFR